MSSNNTGGITLTSRVLSLLPATMPELAAICGVTQLLMNGILYGLKDRGVVVRTDKKGQRSGKRGPRPALWDRA